MPKLTNIWWFGSIWFGRVGEYIILKSLLEVFDSFVRPFFKGLFVTMSIAVGIIHSLRFSASISICFNNVCTMDKQRHYYYGLQLNWCIRCLVRCDGYSRTMTKLQCKHRCKCLEWIKLNHINIRPCQLINQSICLPIKRTLSSR